MRYFLVLSVVAALCACAAAPQPVASTQATLGRIQERKLVAASLERGSSVKLNIPYREQRVSTQSFPEPRVVSIYEHLVVLEGGASLVVRSTSSEFSVGQCVQVFERAQAESVQISLATGCRP